MKGLSSKTILEHHRLLHAMLQNAVYWQILPYNPADRVKPPKHVRPQIKYYDDVQCKQLLEALENEEIKFQKTWQRSHLPLRTILGVEQCH